MSQGSRARGNERRGAAAQEIEITLQSRQGESERMHIWADVQVEDVRKTVVALALLLGDITAVAPVNEHLAVNLSVQPQKLPLMALCELARPPVLSVVIINH